MQILKTGHALLLNKRLRLCLFFSVFSMASLRAQTIANKDDQALALEQKPIVVNDTLRPDSAILEDIVVTAGRTRQYVWEVPQKIERISHRDIEMTPALDATDLLKKSSAINVIQYPGILSGVGFRGFRPDYSGLNQHTLILIDGRPAGATNLGTIDLNFVDHMEVLKGPASALYGAQAMGGVINILTPQSAGAIKGKLFGNYGSFKTFKAGGQIGGNITSKLDFDASAVYFKRAKDIKMGKGNLLRKALGGGTSMNRYPDGHDSLVNDRRGDGQLRPNTKYGYYSTSGRVGYQVDKNWRVDLKGTLFHAHDVESPGDIFTGEEGAGLKNINRNNYDISATGLLGSHTLSAKAYYARERSTSFAVRDNKGEVIENPYKSARNSYKWYGAQLRDAVSMGEQKLIFGYDFNRASSENRSFKAPVSGKQDKYATAPNSAIVTSGLYVQGQLSFFAGKLLVNPGVRTDFTDFRIFNTPGYTKELTTGKNSNAFTSPSLSAQWNIADGLAFHTSIGRAFITPDAYEVAGNQSEGNGSGKVRLSQGNPDLKNESSLSEDLGIKFRKNGLEADLTFFNTHVRDRIASVSAPPAKPDTIAGDVVTSITRYYNANKSRMRGWEISAAYNFGALANYSYLLKAFVNMTYTPVAKDFVMNPDGTEVEKNIQNVSKMIINYGLDYGRRKFNARLTGRFMGRRWDTDYNDALRPLVYYPAFMTVDAALVYNIQKRHQLSLTLSNITDENYYEKRGYNMPGRTIDIGYCFSFGK